MTFWTLPPKELGFWHPVTLLATWFGSGLLRPAPGTWGSLASLPFAYGLLLLGGRTLLLVSIILVFAVGVWAAGRYEAAGEKKDPGTVVIDETAGQWLTLLFVPMSLTGFLLAFGFFRLFDILKPWPVKIADQRLSGGFGIMADDIVAALYAGLVCLVAFRFLPIT